jgi:hypothetical protein
MRTTGGLLTFAEVRAAGRPAFFYDYGEALVYWGDQIFDLRDWSDSLQSGAPPVPLPSVLLEQPVGIEYGWRHADACDCPFCEESDLAYGRRSRDDALRRSERESGAGRPRPGAVAAAPEP